MPGPKGKPRPTRHPRTTSSADDVLVSQTRTPTMSPTPKKAPPKRVFKTRVEEGSSRAASTPAAQNNQGRKASFRSPTPPRPRQPREERVSHVRSSSADDALGGGGRPKQHTPTAGPHASDSAASMANPDAASDPRFDSSLVTDVRAHFGEGDIGTKLLGVLQQKELFEKEALREADRGDLLLGAAMVGFRTVHMGKLKDWLRLKQEEMTDGNAATTPAAAATAAAAAAADLSPAGGGGSGVDGNYGMSAMVASSVRKNSSSRVDRMSISNRSSVDSNFGMGGGGNGRKNRLSMSNQTSSASTLGGATLAQLVSRRFHGNDPATLLAFLNEDCLVYEEEELAWAGEGVVEAAKQCGRLNLVQVHLLMEWCSQMQQRRVSGRRSSQEILLDPFSAKAEEDALKIELGTAVEDAIRSGDPKAKHRAALAMYQISKKKRHFVGLRPGDSVPRARVSVDSVHPPLVEEDEEPRQEDASGGSSSATPEKSGTRF